MAAERKGSRRICFSCQASPLHLDRAGCRRRQSVGPLGTPECFPFLKPSWQPVKSNFECPAARVILTSSQWSAGKQQHQDWDLKKPSGTKGVFVVGFAGTKEGKSQGRTGIQFKTEAKMALPLPGVQDKYQQIPTGMGRGEMPSAERDLGRHVLSGSEATRGLSPPEPRQSF